MTIAEFITQERTDELMQQLEGVAPSGTFWCDEIEYAVPDERLRFERVLTLPLGPPESRTPHPHLIAPDDDLPF